MALGLNTPITLRNLFTKLLNTFDEVGVPGNLSSLDPFILRVPSTSKFNTYGFFDMFNLEWREWIGQRAVVGLGQRVFTIYNKDYEKTFGVDRDTLDDNGMADAELYTRALAEGARALPFQLILDLLQNGQSRVGYDGQNFFDTDHPTNIDNVTGTQSNYLTSTALTRANYISARTKMMQFKGASGRSWGAVPRILLVPPELEDTARNIVDVGNIAIAGGVQENSLKGTAQVVVVNELSTAPTAWYLIDPNGMLKPFILQERKTPTFVSKTNPNDDNLFWQKELIFGGDARYGAGYGAWWKIIKAVA